MKKKIDMNNISGQFEIQFDEFPEWEEFPERGKHKRHDSRVFEFEFEDGFFTFVVKVRIETNYERWFLPQDMFNPLEDEILDYAFSVEAIGGTREYKGESMKLNDKELEQITPILLEKITII